MESSDRCGGRWGGGGGGVVARLNLGRIWIIRKSHVCTLATVTFLAASTTAVMPPVWLEIELAVHKFMVEAKGVEDAAQLFQKRQKP
jgi:hypothetical protein